MGLDMFALKIASISDGMAASLSDTLCSEIPAGLNAIEIENNEDFRSCAKDLLPYSKEINLKKQITDIKKIKEDFQIPEDSCRYYTCLSENEQLQMNFQDKNEKIYEVKITKEDLIAKYTKIITVPYLVFHCQEIGYWRKNYNLQNVLYELYDGCIENCGYHKCSVDMINAMKETGCVNSCDCFYQEDEAIFYHEWY